jgi:hypothetical protein
MIDDDHKEDKTALAPHLHPITYLLTPWSRVLLEKLTGFAASQIPRIYGTQKFITYSQMPATCPYPEPASSSPHNPLPLPEDPS